MRVNAFRTMKPPGQRTRWPGLGGKALHLARLGRSVKEACAISSRPPPNPAAPLGLLESQLTKSNQSRTLKSSLGPTLRAKPTSNSITCSMSRQSAISTTLCM